MDEDFICLWEFTGFNNPSRTIPLLILILLTKAMDLAPIFLSHSFEIRSSHSSWFNNSVTACVARRLNYKGMYYLLDMSNVFGG